LNMFAWIHAHVWGRWQHKNESMIVTKLHPCPGHSDCVRDLQSPWYVPSALDLPYPSGHQTCPQPWCTPGQCWPLARQKGHGSSVEKKQFGKQNVGGLGCVPVLFFVGMLCDFVPSFTDSDPIFLGSIISISPGQGYGPSGWGYM